jgi:methyl-accepting chemotaxis protein
MKLKYKLPIILFFAFLIIASATFTVSLTNSARLRQKSQYEMGRSMAESRAEVVKGFLDKRIMEMKVLQNNILAIRHLSDKDKLEILNKMFYATSNQPAVTDVYLFLERGAYFSADKTEPGKYFEIEVFHPVDGGIVVHSDGSVALQDNDQFVWYFTPKKTRKLILAEPYRWTYPNTNKERRIISFNAPVIADGEFIGVLGLDMDLGLLQKELFDGMADSKTNSYAVLVSHEGLIAEHPKNDMLFTEIGAHMDKDGQQALKDAIKSGSYHRVLEKSSETGDQSLISYVPVLPEGLEKPWSLGYIVDLAVVQAEGKRIQNSTITIGFFCVAAWGVFLLILMSAVFGNITRTVEALSRMTEGDGDLTIRFQERGKDEFGMMARGLNRLMDKLHSTIKTTQKEARNLSGTSASLLGLSENLSNSSETTFKQSITVSKESEVTSEKVTEIAGEAERASATATELSATAEEMGRSMNTMTAAVGEMHESFSKINADTRESKTVAGIATEKVADAMGVMDALANAAKEIEQFTDVIKSIAKKTNLLAINATVEAARAGEAGKGFAVVAGEVKQLANQSADNANDITSRVENIRNGTEHAIDAIKEIAAIITKISESANSISESVERQIKVSDNLAGTAKDTNVAAQEVVKAVDDVAHSVQIAAKNAGDAADRAKTVSDSIGVIHGDAEKTNAYSISLKEAANSLRATAEDLDDIVSKFRT